MSARPGRLAVYGRKAQWAERLRRAVELHEKGEPVRLIAKRLGFAEGSLQVRLRELGITPNVRKPTDERDGFDP